MTGRPALSGEIKLAIGVISVVLVVVVIAVNNVPMPPAGAEHQGNPAQASSAPPPVRSPSELVSARKAYARELEDKLLDAGLNAHVRTLGPAAETLKVNYYYAGRVMGHSLGKNEGLFSTLTALNFSLMRLEGYSYIAQWYPDGHGWTMQEHESSP